MSATLWNRYPAPIFDRNGEIASGALAYFYDSGTTTPRRVYTDGALSIPHAFPVVASATGLFAPVFLQYGDYRVRVTDATGFVIQDADAVSNPTPPVSGGGSGIVVSQDMVWNTGDESWRKSLAISRTGWVIQNATTIGSATSGATQRANADTQNLFLYLWAGFSDTICPVSGGRGGSAAADYAANKTITLPDMKGRGSFGLDDMGGAASSRIQVSTTITTTIGSMVGAVGSASGLAIGMKVATTNFASGTMITGISGATITFSGFASASGSAVAARFSFATDAQIPGNTGGANTRTLLTDELPASGLAYSGTTGTNSITTGQTTVSNAGATLVVSTVSAGGGGITIGGFSFSGTTANMGGGLPHGIMPPFSLGTWYMRLAIAWGILALSDVPGILGGLV